MIIGIVIGVIVVVIVIIAIIIIKKKRDKSEFNVKITPGALSVQTIEELNNSARGDDANKPMSSVNVLNTEVFCAPDAIDSERKPEFDPT